MLRLRDVAGATVDELVTRNREATPQRPAMIWQGAATSWAELDDTVTALARGLAGLGLRRGDRVAILLPNRPEVVQAYFAAARLGAVAVPLNPALTGPELAQLLTDSAASAILLSGTHAKVIGELVVCGEVSALRHVIDVDQADYVRLLDAGRSPGATFDDGSRNCADPVVIYYTSGTTGVPKGAVHSHFSVLSTALSAGLMMDLTAADRVLLCTPLYHSAAMHTFLMSHALFGGSWVVAPGFDAAAVLDSITHDGATVYFGVVPMLIATLAVPDLAARTLSNLRILFTGASPVPQELKRRCMAAFPDADLIDGYGCTESGPAGTSLHARDALAHPGSVGTPWPYLQAAVLDVATGQPAPPGQIGEIVLRGPTEMLGYHNRPEATVDAFAGGWLHTGDLGRMDGDGFLYINGRVKDMLIRGGVNIYPREIEEVLYTHPAIAEAAVFGVPDQRMGEEVMACVTVQAGAAASPQEVVEHCSVSLAHFKRPCYLQVVDELPHNATGKILKYRLQERYADPGSRGPRLHRGTAGSATP